MHGYHVLELLYPDCEIQGPWVRIQAVGGWSGQNGHTLLIPTMLKKTYSLLSQIYKENRLHVNQEVLY